MSVVYRISCDDILVYANNVAACDDVCADMYKNGYEPSVKRMKKSDVPLSEIQLVIGL